jgi:hypothetical protein
LTRFIVLNAARTGSTMLAHMLNSHADVRCHGEVLGPGKGKPGDRLVGVDYATNPDIADRLMLERDNDPQRFLEERVYGDDSLGAAGFKIKYEELQKPDFGPILDWLVDERSIKVIHLVRRNRLKRFVSEVTAVRIYGSFQLTDAAQRPEAPRFTLSAEECRADFSKQEGREARFGGLFREHDVFDVGYEDLTDPSGAVLLSIQRFLGVDPVELRTPTLKLNPDRVQEVLENYDELRQAFSGTPYSAYFEG